MSMEQITSLPFSTAAAAWFEEHKRYIKPNTARAYNDALKPLCKFLSEKPINEIEIVHIRMYQDLRKAKAGAHAINREVGVIPAGYEGIWRVEAA